MLRVVITELLSVRGLLEGKKAPIPQTVGEKTHPQIVGEKRSVL